jgi:phage FluMu protein Com
MNLGDIVLNPKNHGDLTCVIIKFSKYGKQKKAILAPFTKLGYPSTNHKNWISCDPNKLIQAKKRSHLEVCPECKIANIDRLESHEIQTLKLLKFPLKWPNIYSENMRCKNCKKFFRRKDVTHSGKTTMKSGGRAELVSIEALPQKVTTLDHSTRKRKR